MKHEEHNIQCAIVEWFRLQYRELLIFAIPNGGRRNPREAKRLKREGVLPGVPDLFIPFKSLGYYGLFIEMKSEKGRLSKDQKDIQEKLKERGYRVVTCYSFDDAVKEIKYYIQ